MNNREALERRIGFKINKSSLEFASELVENWHGSCVYGLCPAYAGFSNSKVDATCSVPVGEESAYRCKEAILTWLNANYA